MKILLWWTSAQPLHYFRNFKNKPDNNNKLDNNTNIIIVTIMTAAMVFCDCRTALENHVFTDGKVAWHHVMLWCACCLSHIDRQLKVLWNLALCTSGEHTLIHSHFHPSYPVLIIALSWKEKEGIWRQGCSKSHPGYALHVQHNATGLWMEVMTAIILP